LCQAPNPVTRKIAECALQRTRRFEPLLTYFFGEPGGLAASFFAPLPAFTSTSVAYIV
jgi:hypothetical protein